MGGEVDMPAFRAKRHQIRDSGLGARQNDEPRVSGQWRSRRRENERDARFRLQRIKIVEIGDIRQERHGDLH